jgi:DNA-binding CsgD family transcriptional regulator
MSILPISQIDSTQILFDLQQVNEIAASFSGCLEPEAIARAMTEGLVDRFQCAFVRVWLLEPNQTMLRLVASSGMYTNTDGFFGRVPMGSYKVGKIAQNRVSFLSNNLPAEPWVGDREWAIAKQIRGFAGYPLAIGNRIIGVLAVFSHQPLAPEFLEVLQTLGTIATISLDTALQHQQEKQAWQLGVAAGSNAVLSDQVAHILSSSRLTLLGMEQPLSMIGNYVFLRVAEILKQLGCAYARLIYEDQVVVLEAIVPTSDKPGDNPLGEMHLLVTHLGGLLKTQPTGDQRALQITLRVPYTKERSGLKVQILCTAPLLQLALTQLAHIAGLHTCDDRRAPLITDDLHAISSDRQIIWLHQSHPQPAGICAQVELSIQPDQLYQAVEAVSQGRTWGLRGKILSDRELEILVLLTQGLRDRDIADRLIISESTVKFHLNNVLTKLKTRTRYQAIYQAIVQGWL